MCAYWDRPDEPQLSKIISQLHSNPPFSPATVNESPRNWRR
jgi:hypothetical protein